MRNINTGGRGAVRKHKEILADVMRWTEQRRRGIIAIDGMCGSGKSFLAREIGEMLGIRKTGCISARGIWICSAWNRRS